MTKGVLTLIACGYLVFFLAASIWNPSTPTPSPPQLLDGHMTSDGVAWSLSEAEHRRTGFSTVAWCEPSDRDAPAGTHQECQVTVSGYDSTGGPLAAVRTCVYRLEVDIHGPHYTVLRRRPVTNGCT
jgi:hypothetical protein